MGTQLQRPRPCLFQPQLQHPASFGMGTYVELTQSLADAFNTLADEAQGLNDRRIVLEHKLRFAHEQLQYLADKYAPATPEITEALAHLQLPPHNTSIDEN